MTNKEHTIAIGRMMESILDDILPDYTRYQIYANTEDGRISVAVENNEPRQIIINYQSRDFTADDWGRKVIRQWLERDFLEFMKPQPNHANPQRKIRIEE